MTIHGTGLLGFLSRFPCPSVPITWAQGQFRNWETDAGGQRYAKSRDLAQVKLATTADGYTKKGPAIATIRDLVQDSFDAVDALMGWSDDPTAVVDYGSVVDDSREVLIRVTDDPILDTIAESCRVAGVDISVDMWWPGDPGVRVRTSREPVAYALKTWSTPMIVVRIDKMGG